MPIPRAATFLWPDARWRTVLVDVAVAVVAAGLEVVGSREGPLPGWAAFLVVFPAVLVRNRWPLVTVLVGAVGMRLGITLVPVIIGLYTQASRRGLARTTWLSMVLATAGAVVLPYSQRDWAQYWQYVLLFAALLGALPVLAGLWMHQRRKLLEALRGRAVQAERERDLLAERAVAAERRRIAGEMHDVVAHRVGVIALQAGALTVISEDPRTGEVAEIIRKNSTAALSELRDVLRVLRADEPQDRTPLSLGGVRELVEEARMAGRTVDLDLPDPLPNTTEQVGRAAYRVVQEALTNAAKHAPGATARVCVSAVAGELVIEVVNDRPAVGVGAAALPSSGYGLVGMRERVTLTGGTVHSGQTSGGGYQVRAAFPLAVPAATRHP